MPLTQLIVLAVLQAVTEVFPLTMEGHAALISRFVDWQGLGPSLPVSVRIALTLAILAYFWRDVADMVVGVIRAAKGKHDPGARLAAQILVATILTLGAGVAFQIYVLGDWTAPTVMGWTIVGVAVLLFVFDSMCMTVKRVEHATYLDAALIGLCQVAALVPGVGGIAAMVIMARLLGYERPAAARFAFLLAAPVLTATAARDAFNAGAAAPVVVSDILAAGTAFFAALIALAILMAWLRRSSFTPFVVYRLLLGGAILAFGYQWIN